MGTSEKWLLGYTIIGFVVGLTMVWQWRSEDPERFHWTNWGVAFLPPVVLLWPLIIFDILPRAREDKDRA